MTDDNFTLSGAATTAKDNSDMGISQMEAAGIESELNNHLTIDDQSSSSSTVADPNVNPAPAATAQNLTDNQPAE